MQSQLSCSSSSNLIAGTGPCTALCRLVQQSSHLADCTLELPLSLRLQRVLSLHSSADQPPYPI